MRKVKTRKSMRFDDLEDAIYYKVKNSKFKQQRLPAWRPVPTFGAILTTYIVFGVIFLVIGIILLVFSSKIKILEKSYEYDCPIGKICQISITVKEDMEKPIMVYYSLPGFYQNHRRYLKSKSSKQLYGQCADLKEIRNDGDCDPVVTNSEVVPEDIIKNKSLNKDEVAIPCGLMAKTYFNDTFSNWTINGNETLEVDEKNIAWDKDKELFRNTPNVESQWLDIQNEHFIVWMRPSGLPDFKKLWGRIRKRDLKKGEVINVSIENNYDVDYYEGKKKLILSTTNVFGGKNNFLGISFIVVGVLSFVLAVVFPIINNYQVQKEKEKEKTN